MSIDRVLITGADGFLGNHLARSCVQAGKFVIGCDIRTATFPELWGKYITGPYDALPLTDIIRAERISTIFHLAGGSSVPASVENPIADFQGLFPGTTKLVLACVDSKLNPHLILFSSAAVYGNPTVLPVPEDSLLIPVSPYGIHKVLAEQLLSHYSRMFGLQCSVLRVFSAYGDGLRKQLIWDVVRRVIEATRSNTNQLEFHGTGNETRDFIHAEDIAAAALKIASIRTDQAFKIFNVGLGIESSIRDVVEAIVNFTEPRLIVKFNGLVREGDPVNWCADVSKLNSIGFVPKVPLQAGLENTARWAISVL